MYNTTSLSSNLPLQPVTYLLRQPGQILHSHIILSVNPLGKILCQRFCQTVSACFPPGARKSPCILSSVRAIMAMASPPNIYTTIYWIIGEKGLWLKIFFAYKCSPFPAVRNKAPKPRAQGWALPPSFSMEGNKGGGFLWLLSLSTQRK